MKFELKRKILHFFFPNRCPVCGTVIGAMERFCPKCSDKLVPYTGNFKIKGSEGFAAAFVYDKISAPAVILMKRGICGNAAFALTGLLAEKLRDMGISAECDIIVPVPMHRSSLRERGYNQAELLAGELSRVLNIPVAAKCIVKSRKTSAQKKLNRIQRMSNLSGAFSVVDPAAFNGKTVLLIDDVCTTGSTLAELTSLVKSCGAKAVYCSACCKTPPPGHKNHTQHD